MPKEREQCFLGNVERLFQSPCNMMDDLSHGGPPIGQFPHQLTHAVQLHPVGPFSSWYQATPGYEKRHPSRVRLGLDSRPTLQHRVQGNLARGGLILDLG